MKMRKIIPILASTLLLLSGCSSKNSNAENNSYRQIDMEEAEKIMKEEKDYIILDARTPEEYEEGHIPHAINIPNETISTKTIPELPDKDQLILVYCRSGNRSKQAAGKLSKLGYSNIVEFGGIIDWDGEIEK
ncbi:MAG: rhodanese-like domain-containing protein [Bacillota bacterium]|nr:rhodanese-like domain-containing protein [Bacillota bacterium]